MRTTRPRVTADGFWSLDGEWPCDENGREYNIGDEFYGPDGDLFALVNSRDGVVIEVLETAPEYRGGSSRNPRGGARGSSRGFKGPIDSDVTTKRDRTPERHPSAQRGYGGGSTKNKPSTYKEYKWEINPLSLKVPEGISDVFGIMDYMYQKGGESLYTQSSKRAIFVSKGKETLTKEERKEVLLNHMVKSKLGDDYEKLDILRTIVGTNIEAAVKVGIADKILAGEPPKVIEETEEHLIYLEDTSVSYLLTSVEGLKKELAENIGKSLSEGLKSLKETLSINYILCEGVGLFQLTGKIVYIAL